MITQERLKELVVYYPETWQMFYIDPERINWISSGWYLRINLDHKQYLVHRVIWLYIHWSFPADCIDHINWNPLDNRLCNLREATRSENMKNHGISKNTSSGYRWVYFDNSKNRWRARCKINGKSKSLWRFKTPEEASIRYEEFTKEVYWEFYRSV